MNELFAIMHHTSKREGVDEKFCTASECFLEYKRLLIAHPDIFKSAEARQVTDFISRCFFEHFLLYQYVLVCPQDSVTESIDCTLASPRPPPTLNGKCAKELPSGTLNGVVLDGSKRSIGGILGVGLKRTPAVSIDMQRDLPSTLGGVREEPGLSDIIANEVATAEEQLFQIFERN